MQLRNLRKRISWMAILIVLQRSPILPWTKNAVLLLGTIVEKCWTWKAVLPTLSTVGGWHSLSGASSYVTSGQSNMSTVTAGDYLALNFTPVAIEQIVIKRSPKGLSYNGNNTTSEFRQMQGLTIQFGYRQDSTDPALPIHSHSPLKIKLQIRMEMAPKIVQISTMTETALSILPMHFHSMLLSL